MEGWPEDEFEPEELRPLAELGLANRGIPPDARQMGLDRNTEEGAMVALAGSLNPAKLSHRVVAWAILAGFVLPLVLSFFHDFF
ncbi:MAG: hypothetical protein ACRDPG_09005 [Nocardioidaceae bacterium]